MLRLICFRLVIFAALLSIVGVSHVAVAATSSPMQELHRQDFGDDDGDGILNYQDPDDNNDGILDSDTPAPTPTPPAAEPDVETPDTDTSNPTPMPQESGTPEEPSNPAPPVVNAPEVQVSALPNTGSGSQSHFGNVIGAASSLAVLATALGVAALRREPRVS